MYSTLKSELLTRINEAIGAKDWTMAEYYTNLLCEATRMAVMEAPIVRKQVEVTLFECPSCASQFPTSFSHVNTCPSCHQPMTWSMHFLRDARGGTGCDSIQG